MIKANVAGPGMGKQGKTPPHGVNMKIGPQKTPPHGSTSKGSTNVPNQPKSRH